MDRITLNADGSLTLSAEVARDIANFIDFQLDRSWDHYTDHVICANTTWEEGKRRMDPAMYDLKEEMESLLNQ